MSQHKDSESTRTSGSYRPPDYVIVVAASDWVKEHFPAAAANLTDALRVGHDRRRDPKPEPEPEPDLEAEP